MFKNDQSRLPDSPADQKLYAENRIRARWTAAVVATALAIGAVGISNEISEKKAVESAPALEPSK